MKKPKKTLKSLNIDKSWTLFLDRDGIVNKLIVGGYVCKWKEFKFIPAFLKYIGRLSGKFGHIIIVTNQRCIAKRLVSKKGLALIHKKMVSAIKKRGGRVDRLYYCPHEIEDGCSCRKPKIGMLLKAKKAFKNIKFAKSVVIGDFESDMEFARKAGMTGVLISPKTAGIGGTKADYVYEGLEAFWKAIK
ncbi:MAG: HAD-IIIA family hydrolase [Deltaproteobacteria bacterium]|nr:HAD-IIIA family hydrolase [Deltaproteobacteria bacterium]